MAWTWTIPTARFKTISSWLVFVRVLQALATLFTTALNGGLLAYINIRGMGLSKTMHALEFMVCMAFIYSGIVVLMLHPGRKRRRSPATKTLAIFIACDAVFLGLMIVIITLLARSGVPVSCGGLRRHNIEIDDDNDESNEVFVRARSGDEDNDDEGALGKFCTVQRIFYCMVIALMYSYIVSIILSVLRILEPLYTKTSRVNDILEMADHAHRLEPTGAKVHRRDSFADVEDPSSPVQGGIFTGVTSSPSSPVARAGPMYSRPHYSSSAQASSSSDPPALPPRGPTVHLALPVSPMTPPTRSPVISPVDQNRAAEDLTAYQDTVDPAAEAAMVTDGYRQPSQQGFPSLPPYSPGPSRGQFMEGHGNENNEMRLSEYVKGQTRAQNMKDAGGGL